MIPQVETNVATLLVLPQYEYLRSETIKQCVHYLTVLGNTPKKKLKCQNFKISFTTAYHIVSHDSEIYQYFSLQEKNDPFNQYYIPLTAHKGSHSA